jgi:cobalt-zinc-cadmium efflux system outer membrane protein
MRIPASRVAALKIRRSNPFPSGRRICALALSLVFAGSAAAQTAALTWEQVRERFIAANPTLMAARINIDESKAQEITAFLRPNPNFGFSMDQIQGIPSPGTPYRPFAFFFPMWEFDYLHERQHKRELRLESAQKGTGIAESESADQERTLLFSLRSAFVQTLQAKAQLALAKEEIDYFEKQYAITQDRYRAGDIAQMDMQRIHLQRVQYDSDYQSALVNLRTAKIQMLMLLNQRTPIDQFDIDGRFDFNERTEPLERFRDLALAERPDLRAAMQAVAKADTDHRLAVANGSTDPTFSLDIGRNPPITIFFGVGISIPLRIFDRNQGEKLRTEIDIRHAQRLKEATQAQVFSDVDSAYFTLVSSVALLTPYKATYLAEALDVRNKVAFAYQRGGAALLDYLQAQQDYRTVQQAYINLVGSYLLAAGQLDMAVGREVVQ